jgi:hypothetical protein
MFSNSLSQVRTNMRKAATTVSNNPEIRQAAGHVADTAIRVGAEVAGTAAGVVASTVEDYGDTIVTAAPINATGAGNKSKSKGRKKSKPKRRKKKTGGGCGCNEPVTGGGKKKKSRSRKKSKSKSKKKKSRSRSRKKSKSKRKTKSRR